MTLEAIAIIALATWRLSYMLVSERGPFALFEHIRRIAGVKIVEMTTQREFGIFPELKNMATNEFGQALGCVYCVSVWVAPVLLLLWSVSTVGQMVVVWLAVSGAALVLGSVANIGR